MPTPPPALAQALLAQAGHSLALADRQMRAGELQGMHEALAQTAELLSQLAERGHAARRALVAQAAWDGEAAQQTLWRWLARLKAVGCSAFPFAGTLLGLVRDGRLLPGDKDADLAVWLEDFGLAVALLEQSGWQRAGNVPPFDNFACLVEADSGLSVDLFGIRRDPLARRLEGGVWMYGRPASHQRVTHYPWFELAARDTPAGPVWWPEPAESLLQALYGDWRTPQPDWDSLVSCLAVQELNLHWRCWALKSLCDRWLTGDLARTLSLLDQIERRTGTEPGWQRMRRALQRGLATQ